MLNFIICDDKREFIEEIEFVIDKVMMSNNEAYHKHIFYEYNKNFHDIIYKKIPLKIYILDIEVQNQSGIDIAREIREKDIESMIIFITAYYEEYMEDIIKSKFMFLDFINKRDNYKKQLEDSIIYVLDNIKKKNIIRFKDHGIIYTLPTKDIIYIYRDKDRKCILKTESNEFTITKSLIDLYELLDDRFVYSHRACIVNLDRIKLYDKRNRKILFDTNDFTYLVSNRFKMK